MLNSPNLVSQNMVCGSKTDQRDHFPGIYLDVSLFSWIHQICIPTFPLICSRKVIHIQVHIHFTVYTMNNKTSMVRKFAAYWISFQCRETFTVCTSSINNKSTQGNHSSNYL